MRIFPHFLGLLLLHLLIPAVFAQAPQPLGNDFEVSDYTPSPQISLPRVASNDDGTFLVVWSSLRSDNGDADPRSVQGRLFSSAGLPLGGDFLINSETTASQELSSASDLGRDGDFLVVWHSGASFTETDVLARRIASDGTPIGTDFAVHPAAPGRQHNGVAASADDGSFIVAWTNESSAFDADQNAVEAQRFDSTGEPIASEFLVNEYTDGAQSVRNIAMQDDGRFAVLFYSSSIGSGSEGLQLRLFSPDGDPIDTEFPVHPGTDTWSYGDVSAAPSGEFVVTGTAYFPVAGDPDPPSVLAQRISPDGDLIDGEFVVNTVTTGWQTYSSVEHSPEGDFLVIWHAVNPGEDITVYGQRFGPDGERLGGEIRISDSANEFAFLPAVATQGPGHMVAVYQMERQSPTRLRARRIRLPAGLGDRVFSDGNWDGIQDPDEGGIGGVRVNLYERGGLLVDSQDTDSDGRYLFADPPHGPIYLEFEPPQNLAITLQDRGDDDELDSDAEPLSGQTIDFSLRPGEIARGWDAGLSNGLGDRVFLDLDGDGLQDGGEPGVGGVIVRLLESSGAELASTVTGADGRYNFTGLGPETYILRFEAPQGFDFTMQNQGSTELDSDADPATGETPPIFFAAGDLRRDLDAGLVPTASVGNRVWLDDGNGIQDGGEPGVPGVTVRLYAASGDLLDDTVTDTDGGYTFAPGPGDYFLEFLLPSTLAFAPRDQGIDDAADSDVNAASGTTSVFNLTTGEVDGSRDAGLEPAVIGNFVWIDGNGDGRQQPGEPGLGGVTVRLLDAAGFEVARQITAADGRFGFADIATGTYRLEVIPPAGATFSPRDVGGDDLIDSDVDPASGRTALVDYVAGSAARFLDAGLQPAGMLFMDGFESGGLAAWSQAR